MILTPFFPRQPIPSSHMSLILMTLDDWALVDVSGQDSEKYMQSQVTADVMKLTRYQHLLVAHCNPKGKMWSNLRLFRSREGFSFIERRSVRDTQLTEMRKYAVFSKVTFFPNDSVVLLGVAGFQARAALAELFSELPNSKKPLVDDGTTYLLWFSYPIERFLLVTNKKIARHITEILVLHRKAQIHNSNQWLALHIEAGIPIIDFPNSGQFIPQATNLQELGGIDFEKGCYIGQEIVARAKYRGINKRSLWCLIGTTSRVPEAGEDLETKINDTWRRIGTILASVRLNNGHLLVQAVMNNDMKLNNTFRIRDDMNTLNIQPLIYSKNDDD